MKLVEGQVKKNRSHQEEYFVLFCFVLVWFFDMTYCVGQAGFELEILLPQQGLWAHRPLPLCPIRTNF